MICGNYLMKLIIIKVMDTLSIILIALREKSQFLLSNGESLNIGEAMGEIDDQVIKEHR